MHTLKMKNLICDEFSLYQEEFRINSDAMKRLISIMDGLKSTLKNNDIHAWIDSNFDGELAEVARQLSSITTDTDKSVESILRFIISEILFLSSEHIKEQRKVKITERSILCSILRDQELKSALYEWIPNFAYFQYFEGGNLMLRKKHIKYLGTTSQDFKIGLYNVLGSIVKYYSNKLDKNELHELQLKVANAIIHRARELNTSFTLSFLNLINATIDNPDLVNIPIDKIFKAYNN